MPSYRTRIATLVASLLFIVLALPGARVARAAEYAPVAAPAGFAPLWEDASAARLRRLTGAQPGATPLASQAMPEDAAWEGLTTPATSSGAFLVGEWHGKLVLAGSFAAAGHVACGGVALWDGTSFEALPAAGSVQLMTIWNDQIVVAVLGPFPNYSLHRILRFNGATWDTIGITNHYPLAMTSFAGKLVIGGQFSAVSGVTANRIAAFDGTSWSTFGSGFAAGYRVQYLASHAGTLVAAGNLLSFSDNSISAWDGALGAWQLLGQFTGSFRTLASDGVDLYVAGTSLASGATTFGGMARWDGATWSAIPGAASKSATCMTPWSGRMVANLSQTVGKLSQWDGVALLGIPGDSLGFGAAIGSVNTLGTWGTRLVATGGFVTNGSVRIPKIAIYDGTQWSTVGVPWDASMRSPQGAITSLETWNGKLVAAGAFGLVADQDHYVYAPGMAVFDGTHWAPLSPNYVSAQYQFLGELNGDLIVAGYLLSVTGTSIQHVARWNGSGWSAVGSSAPDNVYELASYHGELYLAHDDGAFPVQTLARWNGVSWQSVGTGISGGGDYVEALGLFGDSLAVGGTFDHAGGVPALDVALWDGVAWHALGDGLDGIVYAVGSWNGRLVAGGTFTHSGLAPVAGAAMWDGAAWQQMGTNAVEVDYFESEGGELLASGDFRLPDATVITTVAHWTGTDWHLLGSGTNDLPFATYAGYLYDTGTGVVHGHVSHGLSRVPLGAVLDVPRPHPPIFSASLVASPNPSRGAPRFTLALPVAGHARVSVVDVAGRVVAKLVDGPLDAGEHPLRWATPAPPGVYFARLEAPGGVMRVARVVRFE